jgi:hypothetical protein
MIIAALTAKIVKAIFTQTGIDQSSALASVLCFSTTISIPSLKELLSTIKLEHYIA